MYKGYKKGFKQVIDVADFYLCNVYDFLWGKRLYRIADRAYSENRHMNWYERIAYTIGEYLPPRIMTLPNFLRAKIIGKRVRRLEKILFKE